MQRQLRKKARLTRAFLLSELKTEVWPCGTHLCKVADDMQGERKIPSSPIKFEHILRPTLLEISKSGQNCPSFNRHSRRGRGNSTVLAQRAPCSNKEEIPKYSEESGSKCKFALCLGFSSQAEHTYTTPLFSRFFRNPLAKYEQLGSVLCALHSLVIWMQSCAVF